MNLWITCILPAVFLFTQCLADEGKHHDSSGHNRTTVRILEGLSERIMEKTEIKLTCEIIGPSKDDIYWFKADEKDADNHAKLNNGTHIRIMSAELSSADSNSEKATKWVLKMRIAQAEFTDRGEYICGKAIVLDGNAYRPNFNHSDKIFVRIHSRFSALWPSIGIVCQLIVLAFIIGLSSRTPLVIVDD